MNFLNLDLAGEQKQELIPNLKRFNIAKFQGLSSENLYSL
jgi:hypothetical protein